MPNFEINILENRFKAATLTRRNGEEISNGSTNNLVHTIQKKYNLSKSINLLKRNTSLTDWLVMNLKYVDFI